MKKNRTLRVSALLLALTLITTCFVGGTFAKYTSSKEMTASAKVAKWSFVVNSKDITKSEAFTFNLFETINDTGNSAAETDVANTGTLIAPGTAGSFDLVIENKSEVTAAYVVELTETNSNDIPLRYSVDNTTWYDSLAELKTAETATLVKNSVAVGASADTITVYWQWVFDSAIGTGHATQTDVTDTALGVAAQEASVPSVQITAKVTATQVD